MLIAVFGESCVGKSTLAKKLGEMLQAEIFTGKDFLRLAKNETVARKLFQKRLSDAVAGGNVIYVISEHEHLALLPEGTIRVLMTADLDVILERFAKRMHGTLPSPVKTMLERKHGCFDQEKYDVHIRGGDDLDTACGRILRYK